ncbi:MAG TPA: YbjN domain-containing protein [Bacteroidota bacterium]|nr:YbjN domain-containing protein [Bacteroidota bacterium]
MDTLTDAVEQYFAAEGWDVSRSASEPALRMGVSTKNARWQCVVNVDEDEGIVFLHSVCPLKSAPESRPRTAEFLMRLNRTVYLGHFVMDFDSGEIRFETYVHGENGAVRSEAMQSFVNRNIATMDRYVCDIARVISTEITPAEAMTQVLTGAAAGRGYIYN